MDFASLLALADKAIGLISEGTKVATEFQQNYAEGKEILSVNEQAQLDAKLTELQAKSAAVHSAIQAEA